MANYDNIAADWTIKRKRPWNTFIDFFSECFPVWSEKIISLDNRVNIIVDLGAGAGRHSNFFFQFCERLLDIDESRQMLLQNPSKSYKIQASMTNIPLRPNLANGITAVASIHHIPKDRQESVINEISRIASMKAFVCITVWRFFQPKFKKLYLEQMHKWALNLPSLINLGDVHIPWTCEETTTSTKNVKKPVLRFYHLFRAGEFSQLMRKFVKIKKITTGNQTNKDNFFFFGTV
jgi:hypothetical protein